MRFIIKAKNGVDNERFFIRNIDTLHAHQKIKRWWGRSKKVPVDLKIMVCLERKDMDRSFCGTDGLFIYVAIGDVYLSYKKLLYTSNPIKYYALQTQEDETYYFNYPELNNILRVCTFNECLGSLKKASGF